MNKIHQPHDSLFKKAFGNPKATKDFLTSTLNTALLKRINLDTLQLENSSFISEELSKIYSDLIFSMQIDQKKSYIYCLIEFQMEVDENMVMRLWEYNTSLMRQHINQGNKELPVIINIVLYAGKNPYTGHKRMIDGFSNPDLVDGMLRDEFVIDLNTKSSKHILKDGSVALAELITRIQHKRDFYTFLEETEIDIGALINESPYGASAVYYMMERDAHKPEHVLNKIRNLDPGIKQNIMSGLSQMLQEKEQQTMSQVVQGMANAGATYDFMTKSTRLSQAEIKAILKKKS